MSVLQAIILGIVQGLAEFFPVSSSGHLILVPWLFGWHFFIDHPDLNKTFDVALHLGTFLAVLAFMWRDVVALVAGFFRSLARRRLETPQERLAWLLLISTIPAGVLGVALEETVEDALGKPYLIAILMIVFGIVLWLVDRAARSNRSASDLRWRDALLIGMAQALALAPGVSRSGITIVAGRGLALDRESAVRYSFLLSIPVVGGAAVYKALGIMRDGLPAGTVAPFLAGIVSAAVAGLVAVWFLLRYVRTHDFRPFVVYRIAVGLGVFVLIALGVRHALGI